MVDSVSNGIVSASDKGVWTTLDSNTPMKMNRNPIAFDFDFNCQTVTSRSQSTTYDKDEDGVPTNDPDRIFFLRHSY